MLDLIFNFIISAIGLSTPLIFGSTGEIITEKSGHLNLGIPGIMYVGGISGIMGAFLYENAAGDAFNPFVAVIIPIICTIIGSGIMGLIYCFLTVTLRANQNVTGLMLTTFGIGIGNYFGGKFISLSGAVDVATFSTPETSLAFRNTVPFADSLGAFGRLIFGHSFLVYVAIVIAIITAVILRRTRVGLKLRAVGENPATADAAGINVTRYRYVATIVGSIIAGFGGLQYIMDKSKGIWSNNAFGDLGWLAVAIVIFALWKPDIAIIGSFLFGILLTLPSYITGLGMEAQELFKAIPYVVTIIVLVITSTRKKREFQPPESLGTNYFREER